ncbi:hypothetical protein PHAVU_006G017900 [Phaseolus vulgaris]|uniref:RING-type E3 ubiquitin transferase n=1 Tax=Phaseolus vulgaris TaxID=3885 RepID=V7BJI8_PHAVU|nr:hypothetical protein PHAVU_006G017900g [Phaseolus vulgaris]ESW18159.1 hypothetical protein PHAVU_006G017900g [Phaseolus vulgaris]
MPSQGYYYNVLRLDNQDTTIVSGDTFNFHIKIEYHSVDTDTEGLQNLFSSLSISSNDFFREGQTFLQSLLSGLSFSIESIDEITEGVVSSVQELFEVGSIDDYLPLESQHQVIPLFVTIIILDFGFHAAGEDASGEESWEVYRMNQSNETITKTFLKKCTVVEGSDDCCICLEELNINCECYTMPCHHEFHLHCILTWLKTSRVCPLCRYSLPTLDN